MQKNETNNNLLHQMPASGDLFDLTFEALKQSLNALQQRSVTSDIVQNESVKSESIEKKLLEQVWVNMKQSEYKKLERLQSQNHLVDQRYLHLLELQKGSFEQIQSSLDRMLSSCRLQQTSASLRIAQQSNVSERRLQDLMMEVIGEYGKTLTRSQRREQLLLHNSHVEIVMTTWKYLWRRFIARLRFDILNGKSQSLSGSGVDTIQPPPLSLHIKLSMQTLSLPQDQQEFLHILKRLNKKLGLVSDQTYMPYSILRITKNATRVLNSSEQTKSSKSNISGKDKQLSSVFSNQAVKIAHYSRDLIVFLDEIAAWVSTARTTNVSNLSPRLSSVSNRKHPPHAAPSVSHSPQELISNISFAWQVQNMMSSTIWDEVVKVFDGPKPSRPQFFHATAASDQQILQFTKNLQFQYNSSIFNNRVYYCLEERSLARCRGLLNKSHPEKSSETSSVFSSIEFLSALEELYTDYPHTMATLQSSSIQQGKVEYPKDGSPKDDDANEQSLDSVLITLKRMFQSHPFQVVSFETKHHQIHKFKFPISQRHNKTLLDELSYFPAVVKAQSLIDKTTILHFAPASVFVLLESLQSHKSNLGFLPTLFCPILSGNVSKMSILHDSQATPRGSLPSAMDLTVDAHLGTVETKTEKNDEQLYSDDSMVFMFPLNHSCMESLEAHYVSFHPALLKSTAADGWSSLRVLPDEIRSVGINIVSEKSMRGNDLDAHPDVNSSGDKLNSTYVLMTDENSFSLQKSVDSNGGKIVQAVYYLIQFRKIASQEGMLDGNSIFLSTAASDGKCKSSSMAINVDQSEYDDESFDQLDSFAISANAASIQPIPRILSSAVVDEFLFQHCVSSHLHRHIGDDVLVHGVHSDRDPKAGDSQSVQSRANPSNKQQGQSGEADIVDDSSNSSKKSSQNSIWDTSILSSMCHWRSCMCEAVGTTDASPRHEMGNTNLCVYHSEMKKFLDSKATKGSNLESSKYLPKKPPSLTNQPTQRKDLMTIRAASTLLQELWDGRLKSTVKLFAKKMMTDIKFRTVFESQLSIFIKYHGQYLLKQKHPHRAWTGGSKASLPPSLSTVISQIIPPSPTWTLWKNRDYLDSTTKGQSLSLELLNYIYNSEVLISQEIAAFMKLQCFPSQELNAIRRDIKSFKDQQEQMLSNSQYLASSSSEPIESTTQDKRQNKKGGDNVENRKEKEDGYDNLVAILEEESKLCERKLQILGQRREFEEESRLHNLRKAAKMKALEDVQAKDPNSFKNQGGRF